MPNLSGKESASGEDESGIETTSGEDESGIEPSSGEDESGEDESGIESGSGAGMFCLFLTNLIWLFSEFMVVSLFWNEFCSNQETQKAHEEPNF